MREEFICMEEQIRDCFGRVAWSHKTHEKQADYYEKWNCRLTWGKIIVTALASAGGILWLVTESWWSVASCTLSTLLLLINLIFENRNYAILSQKHRDTAAQLWNIREGYLSLLTNIRSQSADIEEIQKRRDELQEKLFAVYLSAQRTSGKAYIEASNALHGEELSFSDAEIDKMLPPTLRKIHSK